MDNSLTKHLCTICARGGSKGVPNKNLRPLNGISLIERTVRQARASGLFTGIAVSSDSQGILQAAMDAGADLAVDRPAELATDQADKSPAIVHCARQAEGRGMVFSVTPSRRSPYFNMVETIGDGPAHLIKPLKEAVLRRQDAPKTYDMNASIYVWRRDVFFPDAPVFTDDTRVFVMPEERSLDIDSELDWMIATFLATRLETDK